MFPCASPVHLSTISLKMSSCFFKIFSSVIVTCWSQSWAKASLFSGLSLDLALSQLCFDEVKAIMWKCLRWYQSCFAKFCGTNSSVMPICSHSGYMSDVYVSYVWMPVPWMSMIRNYYYQSITLWSARRKSTICSYTIYLKTSSISRVTS